MDCDTGRCRASITGGRSVGNAGAQGKPQPDAHGSRELQGESVNPERANDRKIPADGKEGPGDRSGEAHPCIPGRPATMEARHSPHTHSTDRVESSQATSRRDGAEEKRSRRQPYPSRMLPGAATPAVHDTDRIVERALRTKVISARASAMTSCNRDKSIHRRAGSPGIRNTSHICPHARI